MFRIKVLRQSHLRFPHEKYISPWWHFKDKIESNGKKYIVTGWRRQAGIVNYCDIVFPWWRETDSMEMKEE
jgi:hypothetical protein